MDTIITPIIEAMTTLPTGTKVYAGYVPQDPEQEPTVLPFVVTQTASFEPIQTLCGSQKVGFSRVLVTIVARDSSEVQSMATMIQDQLQLSDGESITFDQDGFEYDGELRAWVCQMQFTTFG